MKDTAKKIVIVHILRVLYCYTSYEYPVTQTHIANFLNDSDIPCDRKTVGRNINYLIEAGLPIYKKNGKPCGYYYDASKDIFFVRRTL